MTLLYISIFIVQVHSYFTIHALIIQKFVHGPDTRMDLHMKQKVEESSRVGILTGMTRRLKMSMWQGQLLKSHLLFKISLVC